MKEEIWIEEVDMQRPTAVLKLGGRIGVKQAKELRTRCSLIRSNGYKHIVLNLKEVSFIASSGIGALIVLSGEMRIKGGGVHLVAVSPPVLRVIKLLNVSGFLTIEQSEAELLANLKGGE